jgi:hypothetical protein
VQDMSRFDNSGSLHVAKIFYPVVCSNMGHLPHYQDNRTTQKEADKHPCLERDSNPQSQHPAGQDPRLRPHCHCDRPYIMLHIINL